MPGFTSNKRLFNFFPEFPRYIIQGDHNDPLTLFSTNRPDRSGVAA